MSLLFSWETYLRQITLQQEILHYPHITQFLMVRALCRDVLLSNKFALVDASGAPRAVQSESDHADNTHLHLCHSRTREVRERIKSINTDPARRRSVSRITVVRELVPSVFAALHYTHSTDFDMDEIYEALIDGSRTRTLPYRPWADDPRHGRTLIFTFKYFTIVGDEPRPMAWQPADPNLECSKSHVPLNRCSSVIALSFQGRPAKILNRRRRRSSGQCIEGEVFDPFSAYAVRHIQAYPDWKSTIDTHDSTKHYVNGPEVFLSHYEVKLRMHIQGS